MNKNPSETKYCAINIQYPMSQLILSGKKTIETRKYPIPEQYIGKELLIIETPGKNGKFKARIVGKVIFGASFEYEAKKAFYEDQKRHCVTKDSIWAWKSDSAKFGWPVEKIELFPSPLPAPVKKGIKFTKNVTLPQLE
ncbi:MAG: hypothetical protein AB8G05_24200 [Oligoflexales bacterium]